MHGKVIENQNLLIYFATSNNTLTKIAVKLATQIKLMALLCHINHI